VYKRQACNPGLNIIRDIQTPTTNVYVDKLDSVVYEGQILTYRIKVQNTGNVIIANPVLRDVLPQYVTFVDGSLFIDGQNGEQGGLQASPVVEAAFKNPNLGITLTSLTPGMTKTVYFQVKVDECPPLGDINITNTAYVKSALIAEKSDTAQATIRVRKPVLGIF
jgi:uncharacterized repeat protein (TIGR01451 family)